jgi:hypothetical protein
MYAAPGPGWRPQVDVHSAVIVVVSERRDSLSCS